MRRTRPQGLRGWRRFWHDFFGSDVDGSASADEASAFDTDAEHSTDSEGSGKVVVRSYREYMDTQRGRPSLCRKTQIVNVRGSKMV